MSNDLASLQSDIVGLEWKVKEVKNEFAEFIKDKSIPLDERWEFFKEAPEYLKNKSSYIEHFDAETLLEEGEIVWYDEFYIERYQECELVNVISSIEDRINSKDDYPHSRGADYSVEFLEAFKEEILQKNMHSFVHDW